MRFSSCLAAASLIACPFVALAGDSPAQQEEAVVQAWGGAHADCAEWSDACVVCRRDGEKAACSTPVIACTPQPTACRTPVPGTKL